MTEELSVPQPRWFETLLAIGLECWAPPGVSRLAGKFIPNSFEKRNLAFLKRLATDVQQDGIDIRDLQERVEYLAFVQRTVRVGNETADELKHESLLRAARKALTDATPDVWQIRDLFLAKLEWLTPLHLHLLRFLASPAQCGVSDERFRDAMRSANRVKTITEVLPQLRDQEVFVETLLDDLVGQRLVHPVPPTSGPGDGLRLTDFGRRFSQFVFKDE